MWISTRKLAGKSSGSVSAVGGIGVHSDCCSYSGGSAGGGGGRLALYCDASEHEGEHRGFGGVPSLRAEGGDAY